MNISLKRKNLSKVFSVIFVFIFTISIVSIPSNAAGEVLDINDYMKAGAIITDLYGMYNNTNLAYEVADSPTALTVIDTLYREYTTEAGGDPNLLAIIGAAAIAAGAFALVYDSITGEYNISVAINNGLEDLDGFFNSLFENLAPGIITDGNGNWIWEDFNGVNIFSDNHVFLGNIELFPVYVGMEFIQSNTNKWRVIEVDPATYCYYYEYNGSTKVQFFNFINNSSARIRLLYNNSTLQNYTFNTGEQLSYRGVDNNIYYFNPAIYRMVGGNVPTSNQSVPSYVSSALSGLPIPVSALGDNPEFIQRITALNANPYRVGDPAIGIESLDRPDYEPQPVTVPTNVPVPGIDPLPDGVPAPIPGVPYPVSDPDDLQRIIDLLWDRIVDGDVEIVDDTDPDPDPDPSPDDPDNPDDPSDPEDLTYHTPLLPFIPNFNFQLSSIWYYVVNWVNSIKGFVTLLFNVWSFLPYAIVLPVYATAVIVIVLGVYKRFFM